MGRRRIAVLCLLVAAATLLPATARAADPLRLGALFPFSGSLALLGNETFYGVELATEMINERGGVLGRPVTLVKADCPDATAAANEANRLITQERVNLIIGTYASGLSMAATPVAERNRVVYWEVMAASDDITSRGFRYVFRTGVRSSSLGAGTLTLVDKVIAPKLGKAAKDLRIVQMFEDGAYGTSIQKAVVADAEKAGIKLLANESYTAAKATDLSPLVLRFKDLRPDVVIATSYVNDAILFVRQAKELGLNFGALIGTGAGFSVPDFGRALGKDADGIMNSDFAWGVNPSGLKPESQKLLAEFQRRFKQKYGHDAAIHGTGGFVGAWSLFTEVLPAAGALEPEKVRQAASAVNVPDHTWINGWGLRFGPDGQNQRSFAAGYQWQGGTQYLVYPATLATRQPMMIPLPRWQERK